MYDEDSLLPISALQHLRFCKRRAALVHIEGLWSENRFTAQGNQLHEIAHDPARGENHSGLQVVRGMMLHSLTLGLFGKTDVVEFHTPESKPHATQHATIVEYKRGKPKPKYDREYALQLCAQVLCLEEMLPDLMVSAAIFYGLTRRRVTVDLNDALRNEVKQAAVTLHKLIASKTTPLARYERKCDGCSMKSLCMPHALRPKATADHYLHRVLTQNHGADITKELWE